MPQQNNEVDKFFEGLPEAEVKEADVFEKPTEATEQVPEVVVEKPPVPRENREVRRLRAKMEEKDEMLGAMNERIIELSKGQTQRNLLPSEVPPEWIALYGNTPESQAAWKLNEKLLLNFKESATQDAISKFEAKQDQIRQEQKGFESFIDSELENLEEDFNVDLTSNAPAARKNRREFLELVEKLSPKDSEGTITGYADFASTFEIYQQNKGKEKPIETSDKQKELSARTMQKPGSSNPTPKTPTPGFFGWRHDHNIN